MARASTVGPVFCIGEGPPPGAGDCEDICYGEMCVGASGVVMIEALWSPSPDGRFAVSGFELRGAVK